MKTLKKTAAAALAIAMMAPLGTSFTFADEETVQPTEQPETEAVETITEETTEPQEIEEETTEEEEPSTITSETVALDETNTTNSTPSAQNNYPTETSYYTAYVGVGKSVTIDVKNQISSSFVNSDPTVFQHQVNLNSFIAPVSVTITGLQEGTATLTRTYLMSEYDLATGIHNVNMVEIYTIHVVDDSAFTTQTVSVDLAASTLAGTKPSDYLGPKDRYYSVGSIELTGLPTAGENVVLNMDEYADAITESFSTSYVDNPACAIDYSALSSSVSWLSLTPVQDANGNYNWSLRGTFKVNDESIVKQTILVTDGVEDEEIFADKQYMIIQGFNPISSLDIPVRDGYTFAQWNVSTLEDGTIVYTAQWTTTPVTDPEEPTDPETPVDPENPEDSTNPEDTNKPSNEDQKPDETDKDSQKANGTNTAASLSLATALLGVGASSVGVVTILKNRKKK